MGGFEKGNRIRMVSLEIVNWTLLFAAASTFPSDKMELPLPAMCVILSAGWAGKEVA